MQHNVRVTQLGRQVTQTSRAKGINMDANFWHQKWERGDIGFHQNATNPLLLAHFEKLTLAKGSRVFVPLCGKTRDLAWLLACGYRVVGAELSEIAISELFKELNVTPEISKTGQLTRYRAQNIDILAGDIFAVSADQLGLIDAIYDRAALVALPAQLRERYASHLITITGAAPQLLIAYEYDQRLMECPPFSVSADEIKRHYGAAYQLRLIERNHVAGGLKGIVASTEAVWLLEKTDN
jgi:thiopurine S-methyltransferase